MQNDTVSSDQQLFYVGTYTGGESKGIYKYALNEKGELENLGIVAETINPSYLALSKDGKSLVAVNEKDLGTITAFKIQGDSLIHQDQVSSGGIHPCFVTINERNEILVANYSSGTVSLLTLEENGSLSDLKFIEQHTGKGTTDRQQGPHAHSAYFLPDSKQQVVTVDLGTDELWFSELQNDKMIITDTLAMGPGAGPRHLAFHATKPIIYVLNELNNTISLVKKNKDTYELGQSYSTLPEGFNGFSKAADIHLSPDGKFLYASNRGRNSIVIYRVLDNGSLKQIGFESTRGQDPRNFSLSPDGNFVLVANQNSNNIVCFQRDSSTGKLSFLNDVEAPEPVCILFEN
ncbi:lactonase family protein [Nonlabens spongiae]|nr:lactonase family protein [Nonlabens spongiae]